MDLDKLKKKFPQGILREKHPFYMADAIKQIPDCLEACSSQQVLENIKNRIGDFRPERIFTIGCGTSFHAAEAVAYTLQKILKVPAIANDAYDFEIDTPPGVDQHAMLIAISESGQSITTCLSLEMSRSAGAFTVGISANPESRLAKSADLALTDPLLHELPLGKTRTYLSTNLLGILAGVHSQDYPDLDEFIKETRDTIRLIRENLAGWEVEAGKVVGSLPVRQLRYIVTGFGAQKANADEIRLKIMEVLGESATGFGLEEFTHGPSACFKNDLVVVLLQTDRRTLEKAVRIAQGVAFSDAQLIVITDQPGAGWPVKARVMGLPQTGFAEVLGQFPAVVAAQNLIYSLALSKGLNPDVNLEDTHPELGDIYAFFFPPGTH